MRVSTGMIFDTGLSAIQRQTSSLLHTQQQISSGRRMLKPSDDPVAAARALEVNQAKEINDQYGVTQGDAKSMLGLVDSQLDAAGTLLVRIKELSVQAGNFSLSASDRKSVASELRARFDEMIALANSTDSAGQYLFSGYQSTNKPFAGSIADGVVYQGDAGLRTLQVSGSRDLPVSDSGDNIFMRIKNGNGVFVTNTQSEHSINAVQPTFASWNSTVTAPATPTTTGDVDVRFWVNPAATSGFAMGAADLSAGGVTITAGQNDTFSISVNGAAPVQLTMPGPLPLLVTNLNVQAQLTTALTNAGVVGVTASVVNGYPVLTSTATGSTSSISLSGATGLTDLFGVPASVAGTSQGTTLYDLVDPVTLNSLFTGNPSNATLPAGQAGFIGHVYTSGSEISLKGELPLSNAFDYGAKVVITGTPLTSDIFALNRSTTDLTATAFTQRAGIDAGTVSDPVKWTNAANSGKLELRFWTDPTTTPNTAGNVTGAADLSGGIAITAANNQFTISVNGGLARTVTIPGPYPHNYANNAAMLADMQTAINTALGMDVATVALNGNNFTITSATGGAQTSVKLAAVAGDTGLTDIFGALTNVAGTGTGTYYDLVDATTGISAFTGTASTTGAGGTYTSNHAYFNNGVNQSPISLSNAISVGPPAEVAFDYGASVTVNGIAGSGDAFTLINNTDPKGNGYFVTAAKMAANTNTGSGVVGTGEVLDQAKWNSSANSKHIEVRFWKDTSSNPPTTYYDLVDAKTEKSLFTDTTSTVGAAENSTFTHKFTDGNSIPFSDLAAPYSDFGASVTITGTPASGDVFTLGDSTSESVFDTMIRLVNALEDRAPSGSNANTVLLNHVGAVLANVGQATDNILRVRANIGSHLNEADSLNSVVEDLKLQFSETLSRLQDVDMAEAITSLTRRQTELEAAQKSFTKISQLSLFNYV